ncbi:helix-hairpin-helix domain-containing protein [Amnibacterium soli]
MDSLRTRFAMATAGRPLPLILAAAAAAVVLLVAVVLAAGQASGSEAEAPAVRVVPTAAAPTPALVHVSGAVRHPGLVALPAGSRIIDAITAAGGPTGAADQSGVNLAARVADGQQVVVPKRGAPSAAASGSTAGTGGPATVSLGSATAAQLETLPRIGPALAARIIAYRDAHGGFSSVDQLSEVGGIGPKTLAGLRDLVVP